MTKINIDDLTLGQIKQLTSITDNNSNLNTEIKSNLFNRYVGRYVIYGDGSGDGYGSGSGS